MWCPFLTELITCICIWGPCIFTGKEQTWLPRYNYPNPLLKRNQVLRRYISPNFPHVREIAANCSLAFVNTDEMFDLPRPIIHKNVYIGGLGYQETPKQLDEKFNKLMSKGKEGVIVFSLGTIANFHALDDEKKKAVLGMVRRLPQYHFIIRTSKSRFGKNTRTFLLPSRRYNFSFHAW